MEFIRQHKKISIVVLSCLVVFLLVSVTFGKYIYNIVDSYILETKGMYFNSSVLVLIQKNMLFITGMVLMIILFQLT